MECMEKIHYLLSKMEQNMTICGKISGNIFLGDITRELLEILLSKYIPESYRFLELRVT